MASPMELIGLKNVSAFIAKLIQGMHGDKGNEPKMKAFAKAWSQINNEIKKLEQHLKMQMEKAAQQNGEGRAPEIMAETQAKIAGKTAETKQKLLSKELADRQKRRHKDLDFVASQRRENLKAATDSFRGSIRSLNE